MARIEKLNEKATATLATFVATKFKGVRKPKTNSMNDCALYAAKLAVANGVDYYVIPCAYNMVISPAQDCANSYNDFGYGIRVNAKGELYSMVAA